MTKTELKSKKSSLEEYVCMLHVCISARDVSTEVCKGVERDLEIKLMPYFYEAENMPLYYPTINVV